MTTAVNIGSYCSDFIIQDPAASETTTYYRRIHPGTNKTFYLYIATGGTLTEIVSPFVQPAGTSLTLSQFQLTLTWDKSVRPVYDSSSSSIIPGRDIRNISGTTPQFVAYKNSSTTIQIRRSTPGDDSVATLTSFSSTINTIQEYVQTTEPPYTVERSATAVYLVDDRDDDKGVITSATTMRYLHIRPDGTTVQPTAFVYDLYTPGFTEVMVRRVCYRINKKTSLDSNYSPSVIYTADVFKGDPATTSSTPAYFEDNRFIITNGNVMGSVLTAFVGTKVTFDNVHYIVTTLVADKSVADLFGDFSIGLFRLAYPANTDTTLYLGYDCPIPNISGGCPSNSKTMVLKDYFIFRQPMYSCQFRMYNLGTDEYMMRVVDPDATNSRITLRVDNTPVLTMTTSDPTLTERGWTLESQGAGNRIKLKWNYPESSSLTDAVKNANMYLSITNNVPSLAASGNANTFVCVKCSKIDPVTGTCSGESAMYIDDDMNPLTSPVLASQYALSGVPAVRTLDNNFTIQWGSPTPSFANVFNDGTTDTVSANGDRFFTTQSGVTTLTQRTSPSPIPGVVFIGTEVAGGEILYAKLTGTDTKFVRATPPTVEEGFGWRVTTPNAAKPNERKIVAYLDSTKAFMGNTTNTIYTFTVNNPKIVATVGAYNPDTNTFSLTVTVAAAVNVAYKIGTGGYNSVYSAPLNATPGTMYTFREHSGGSVLGDGETQVPVPQAPPLSITTNPTIGTVTFNSIPVSGGIVANLGDTNSSVVVTARPTGGGTPTKTTPVTYGTYKTSGVTLTGLTQSTTYNVSIDFYRGSTDGGQTGGTGSIGMTLSGPTTTPAGPSIGTVNVVQGTATSPSTLTYSVTGSGSLSPTIYYVRQTTTTTPIASSSAWLLLDSNSPMSVSPPTPPTVITGSNGIVTVNIVPDTSTAYNYFFKVDNVIGTGYINVPPATIPAVASIGKRFLGSDPLSLTTPGVTVPSARTNDTTYATPTLPRQVQANTSLVPAASGTIPVLQFTSGNNANSLDVVGNAMQLAIPNNPRTSVTIALVFRLNTDYNTGFQTIFASGQTWQRGSLHIFISDGIFKIGMAGAEWNSGSVDDWTPQGVTLGTTVPYMLILTLDTSTGKAKLYMNSYPPYEATFNASGNTGGTAGAKFVGINNNIFGLTLGSSAAESIINIGDWVTNNNTHRYLEGNVAEVILYDNKALTVNEIVTLQNYIRTRYSGNAVFGTGPPTISSLIIQSSSTDAAGGVMPYLTYSISSGLFAGVTVSYKKSTGPSKPNDATFPWTLVGPTTPTVSFLTDTSPSDTAATLYITPEPSTGNNQYYFFKVEVSATSSDETSTGVLVNKLPAVTNPTVIIDSVDTTSVTYRVTNSPTSVVGFYKPSTSPFTASLSDGTQLTGGVFPANGGRGTFNNLPTTPGTSYYIRLVAIKTGATSAASGVTTVTVTGITLSKSTYNAGNRAIGSITFSNQNVTNGGSATWTGSSAGNVIINFNKPDANGVSSITSENWSSWTPLGRPPLSPTIRFLNNGSGNVELSGQYTYDYTNMGIMFLNNESFT